MVLDIVVDRFGIKAHLTQRFGKLCCKAVECVYFFRSTLLYCSHKFFVVAMVRQRHYIIEPHHIAVPTANCPAAKADGDRVILILHFLDKRAAVGHQWCNHYPWAS